ncbi:hypothetical protein N8I77_007630 [Diaporthe amygdali]|uniref:Uncharacterized protein n=1 Tax=Phomopsis amygdali TaxID=1214568 RepID=A0AAD9SC13_PHOAM|nr:hypothetical protein N8I77_007630 [Diaporthe amygdali]KAK2604723.1 hypothetical protein N8I77_007630 [Diaporthe amygdali]
MRINFATSFILSVIAAQASTNGLYQRGKGLLLPASAYSATLVAGKRDEATACVEQVGNGAHVEPDTDASFLAYEAFSQVATAAGTKPPDRYSVVPDWVDLKASNGDGTGYFGYMLSELSGYNPDQCADLCSNWSGSTSCTSFVIYHERDPELVWPTTGAPSPACPAAADSPSVTLIKCVFYSVPLYSGNATNVGQYQDDFHVVIAGSTAFNLEAPAVSGYASPVPLHNASLDIPPPVGENGYIRVQTFPDTAYNPGTCADNCAAISTYNLEHGSSELCTSFNSYILYTNGASGVFTCTYYSTNYGASYATNAGQYDNTGNHYTIGSSYLYYLAGSSTPLEKCSVEFTV